MQFCDNKMILNSSSLLQTTASFQDKPKHLLRPDVRPVPGATYQHVSS